MKIFVAGIATETNTFAPTPTGLGAYEAGGLRHADGTGQRTADLRALLDHLRALARAGNHELAIGLVAHAQPSGKTVGSVWEALRDELLSDLHAAMPVQAVILPLHGAMVADGYDDCEGDLIDRIRHIVGPEVPIGVELDLHCHFTERMRRTANVIVAYKEYPHTDVLARLDEVWKLTIDTAFRRITPTTEVFDCRMVAFWHTTREPMKSFVQRMQSFEGQGGVLSVSFGHGFPWGDVPEAGAKVWVITDNDRGLAARLAEHLGKELWALRESTRGHQTPLEQALDQVQALPADAKPLVLADIADNAGGGAGSDSTFILRALVERGIGNVVLGAFFDPGAVQTCREAGVGARLLLRVGGKLGPTSGAPVDLWVTVRGLVEDHGQTVFGFSRAACGPSVWVQGDDGLQLALISNRQQVFGADLFTGLGIDLATPRAIVVKSSQHFHAAFAPLASAVLYVETPGLMNTDFAAIDYQRRDMNFWPRVENPWA